ncbi:MAG: hypothetical protein COV66_00250 [Nitrospinae bacterium CG11_big_fil_rev_8_21_14_0_20_45_15]|nr:MAG: hypothetical protein COV66_00250 [Nitrospinae bacterium CG11_big_fil_rev_8_21_14_0_20_45_15]
MSRPEKSPGGVFSSFYVPSKNPISRAGFFLVLIPWIVYLATISPTVGYKDSPEFIDTAFTLGISHPAGFPTYNLLAKLATFLPFGSIAFKINLFSALFACLTLGMLYLTSIKIQCLVCGQKEEAIYRRVALVSVGFLAFCLPFWSFAIKAEVYTLNAFFVCLIVYLLLEWKQVKDARFLFSAAFLYGLSAGNHATVGLFLPAILILYFVWKREGAPGSLSLCAALFLIGFSVYAYLPLRSFTEPSFDWGNPETLEGFLYQVTDRKDANVHFSIFKAMDSSAETEAGANVKGGLVFIVVGIWGTLKFFLLDVWNRLSPLVAIGMLGGGWLCLQKCKPLFFFVAWIIGINAVFFKGWGGESFFPAYIVACLLTSVFLGQLFSGRDKEIDPDQSSFVVSRFGKTDWQGLCALAVGLWIVVTGIVHYPRMDRSDSYSGETFLKPVFLSLENDAIFLAGISWFQFFYHNDVERLRDDVIGVRAWDFLEPSPLSWITPRRFPELSLPDPQAHRFASRQEAWNYLLEFIELNHKMRPVLTDQNIQLFEQFPMAGYFLPYKNVLLKYSNPSEQGRSMKGNEKAFEEFQAIVEREAVQAGIVFHKNWINKIAYYTPSFAEYYKSRGRFEEQSQALRLMYEFLGQRGAGWRKDMIENLIARNQADLVESHWTVLQSDFPASYETFIVEGWLKGLQGDLQSGQTAFQKAATLQPSNFEPHLEAGKLLRRFHKTNEAKLEFQLARAKVVNLMELSKVLDVENLN